MNSRRFTCIVVLLLWTQQAVCQIPNTEMMYRHRCSESVTDTLTASPLFQPDMPPAVHHAYAVIDSLCRMQLPTTYFALLEHFRPLLTPPVVDSISKYLHRAIAYDPLLFYKYIYQGKYLASHYIKSPLVLYQMYNELRLNNRYGVHSFLAISAGLYRIIVTSVTTETATLSPHGAPVRITCMKADVVETLKGETLTTTSLDSESHTSNHHIAFSYANYWETGVLSTQGDDLFEIVSCDTGIVVPRVTRFGTVHSPKVGDEYMLFAVLNFEPHTSPGGTIYNIWPNSGSQPEGGLFPIVHDEVQDSSNYFGWGVSVPVSTFIDRLNTQFQLLMH